MSHLHYSPDFHCRLLHMLFYVVGMEEVERGRPHPYLFLRMKEIEDLNGGLLFVKIGLLHNLVVQYEAITKEN